MRNLNLLLLLLIIGCTSKQQTGTNRKAEREIYESTETSNSVCDICAASEFSLAEPDTTFIFTSGGKVLVCGYSELQDGRKIYSEFVVSECGSDSIVSFWSAVEEYEIEFYQDTLHLQKLEYLALDDNRNLVKEKWLTESFYYANRKLIREKKLNSDVKYSESQVTQTLQEYESTEWQTQNEATEEYAEDKMTLANRLLIAAVSGSEKAELYFKEFDSKFKPDGAYAEWYAEMANMLDFAKSRN